MSNVINITEILAERKWRRDLASHYIRMSEQFLQHHCVEETRKHLNADDPLEDFFMCGHD